MADKSLSTPVSVEKIETFFHRARKLITPPKEPTIFSIAGRGYYENPASDLLGFFLKPTAVHGFGPLFLRAFFECMNIDHSSIGFGEVEVTREERTAEGKFIDLLVRGSDWALVIENKVYHIQNNPFASYENHALELKRQNTYFAVLSPEGKCQAPKQWRAVSYKDYCRTLRRHFADAMFDHPHSKWMVFAREFVLHYENELYNPVMTKEQFQLVEENLLLIEQVKAMSGEYNSQIIANLQFALTDALPAQSDGLKVVDEGWAYRCVVQPGRLDLALQTPRHPVGNTGRNFRVIVYISGLTPEQEQGAAAILAGMAHGVKDDTSYWTQDSPKTSSEAIKVLCVLAQKLSAL